MSLFKSTPKLNPDKRSIPWLTIEEGSSVYLEGNQNLKLDNGLALPNQIGVSVLRIDSSINVELPVRGDYHLVGLCVNGQAEIQQNQHSCQATPRTAWYIKPGDIHSLSQTTKDFEMFLLMFSEDFFSGQDTTMVKTLEKLGFDRAFNGPITLEQEDHNRFLNAMDQIISELKNQDQHYLELISITIATLLFLIERQYVMSVTGKPLSRQQRIFNDFRELIESHFQHKKSVAEYAQMMQMTAKHLSETVKKVSNHTALYFIQDRILRETQYLLAYTNLNVKQISLKLSFDTASHFGRFFKHHTGKTPLKYRQMLT